MIDRYQETEWQNWEFKSDPMQWIKIRVWKLSSFLTLMLHVCCHFKSINNVAAYNQCQSLVLVSGATHMQFVVGGLVFGTHQCVVQNGGYTMSF